MRNASIASMLLAGAVALTGSGPAHATTVTNAVTSPTDERIVIHARKKHNVVEVQISAMISAPIDLIWRVLTDYDRLAEFIPDFSMSKVLSRDGARAVVRQQGAAHFLWFSFPIDVVVESIEEYPYRIQVNKVSGNLTQLSGRYELDPAAANPPAAGAATRPKYLLRWTGIIEPNVYLPPLVGRAALSHNLEGQFRALIAEIERRRRNGIVN